MQRMIFMLKLDECAVTYSLLSPSYIYAIVLSGVEQTGLTIVKTQFSPAIFSLYFLGVLLGTSYSVPPLQLKRVPLCAGGIIAFVRGFLLNFGVYYAVREALQVPFHWNPVVVFISSFMTIFASVIAITKVRSLFLPPYSTLCMREDYIRI